LTDPGAGPSIDRMAEPTSENTHQRLDRIVGEVIATYGMSDEDATGLRDAVERERRYLRTSRHWQQSDAFDRGRRSGR
jgi:hypothetical protein